MNYRLNRVRFPAAVPADSRIRGHIALLALRELSESVEATYNHRSEPSPNLREETHAKFVQFVRCAKKRAGAFGLSRAWLQNDRLWSGPDNIDNKFAVG